ncbi:MAG: tetratricopeptide repeat protein [Bacteroidota bacterium]
MILTCPLDEFVTSCLRAIFRVAKIRKATRLPLRSNDRIHQLEQFLSEDPNDAFSRYALALELLKMNQLEEADSHLQRLYMDQPEYLATYYQLGKLLEMKKEKQRALATYLAGMERARKKGDKHTLSELQSAYQNLLFSEDE